MAKKEETAVETAQKETVKAENEVKTEVVAENATTEETAAKAENLEAVEVPENAEEISQEEALKAAVDEVNRLREENTAIKQELDSTKEELKKLVEHTNTEAGIAGKQIVDLDAKVKELEEKLAEALKGGNNTVYIELLEQFEAKINEYAGLRRERLRKEFVTDLKEEIQRQKDLLTNA